MIPVRLPRASNGRSAVSIARQCAREGGKIALESFGQPRDDITYKGRANVVTAADYAVEARIHAIIEAAYPTHCILSEETRADTGDEGWVWVIDPIDGTKNYSIGVPFWCVNVALCLDGASVLGLTYDPVRREEFVAVRGRGLTVNGRPSKVSSVPTVAEGVIGYGVGYGESGIGAFEMLRALWPGFQSSRDIGSAALALSYVACGRFDVFVHPSLSPWDIAAGVVQIEEGGGIVTDRRGTNATHRSPSIVAGNPAVHADFLRLGAGRPWFEAYA